MLDDTVTVRAALDKRYAHQELRRRGLPTPEHCEIRSDDFAAAASFLRSSGTPLVVKPAAGTGGGLGTTAGVRAERQLGRAMLLARRRSKQILLERQIPGDVYRLLFLEGELLDVVRRLPPHVTGDGQSTIAELIRQENERRMAARGHRGMPLITMTLDCLFTLESAGLTLRSVPDAGRRVQVKTVTNQSGPDDNFTIGNSVSSELVADARLAAVALGVRLAGIDLITTDPSQALAETGGVVLEVNAGPGLHHHYHVADPENATRVCIPILARLLEASAAQFDPRGHGGVLDDR
jgi:cyanophycin synthetase